MDLPTVIQQPLTWAAIGIVLMIAETLSGEGSLLGFGFGAIILSAIIWMFNLILGIPWLVALFAILGFVMSLATRRVLKGNATADSDINTY
jgi:membrane protein implicated in regulation of membrane protease activity